MAVTFINAMRVPENRKAYFVQMWEEGYDYVAAQPGFIASSLHETTALNDEFQFYTIAVWKDADALIAATSTEWWRDFTERFGFTGPTPAFTSVPALCNVVSDHDDLFGEASG